MAVVTAPISAQLAKDIPNTLTRLRLARARRDWAEVCVLERRLDWLLDKVPRTENP